MLSEGAEVFTPYGATEALPVTHIGSREILAETARKTSAGRGICVGLPVEGARVRVIVVRDEAIPIWSDELLVAQGEVGEITVRGPMVTKLYWARPERTALAKIDEAGETVHRMGDLGYFDERGRLWMCGRKSHRVQTSQGDIHTVPIERIFDAHPAVRQSALVGVGPAGDEAPILLVEREDAAIKGGEALVEELEALAAQRDQTAVIQRVVLYPGKFPLDVRHNAKILREKLKIWAEARFG
jgi:acyl-CoA synthetase (AMP-forming)/AMP-acid ligase II